MTTTVTHNPSGDVLTVTMVLGYTSTAEAPSVVHPVIGLANPDFTVQPTRPRTGKFEFLAMDENQALALLRLLARPGTFTLADAETVMADTTFMVTGALTFTLDVETRVRVVVGADFTEIAVVT